MGLNGNDLVLFRPGPKDMLAVFFYTLIMILAHAVIQEFILDVSILDKGKSIASQIISNKSHFITVTVWELGPIYILFQLVLTTSASSHCQPESCHEETICLC